jgi:phage baseplate assembly protein V
MVLMVTYNDLERSFNFLKNRIFLLFGRCNLDEVESVDDNIQKVKVNCLKDEVIPDMDRIQEYGFETYPYADKYTEGIALFIGGNREKGIVFNLCSRKYRPTDLNEGEVCLYSADSDEGNDNRITIKPDNTIEIKTKDGNLITIDSNGTIIKDSNDNTITMDSSGMVIEDTNGNKTETTVTGMKLTDKNSKTIELSATGFTMLGGTEAYVKGTTHQIALTALCSTMAAIVPAGSSSANIAAIQAAFATFAGTLATMNSTEIKGK